jgi:HD-like signal output (HDOD) protein
VLGFTHSESGRLLADKWDLPADLCEVVSLHHTPEESQSHAGLVALVEIGDLLCRMSGLNYGYVENRQVNLFEQNGFALLTQQCKGLQDFDWARLTFELDSYMDEVHSLVRSICRT